MGGRSTTIVIAVALALGVAITEYVRITKMIPIKQHEQELASVRTRAEAMVKEAENHYRQAVDEEAHRREMSQLFEEAKSRALSAYSRGILAQLELDRCESKLSAFELLTRFSPDETDVAGSMESLLALMHRDQEAFREAERRSAERIQAEHQARKKEKTRLNERRDLVWKEVNDALAELHDALADLSFAKKELEGLGHPVDWPEEFHAMARELKGP